ncbi:MAG: putative phage tail protein [Peptococcales bacterium]|jgi:hypothetical protein
MPDLKDSILTNTTARRMVSNVSPIYDNSYAGLWIFEAISREYEEAWELVNTLPAQLFPETATWGIELWEQRYGIAPDDNLPIEERRRRVITKRSVPKPMNPSTLIAMLLNITGRTTEYQEHTGPYTFGIFLNSDDTSRQVDYDAVMALIRKHKQAHKSFDFAFQTESGATIQVEAGFYSLPHLLAGQARAGEFVL